MNSQRQSSQWPRLVINSFFIFFFAVMVVMWPVAQPNAQQEEKSDASKAKQTPQQEPLTKDEIGEARKLLDQLGYWLDVNAKGLDASLRHALIAFQKIDGRPRTGVLTRQEIEALQVAERPEMLESDYPHVEIDLFRQVLFLLDQTDAPPKILPVSSGSGEWFTEGGVTRQAITPTGRFKIYRKIAGWRKSPLGLLYYPSYIYDGIAIHGNPSVPPEPASHGCIRIPMFAAKEFSRIASIGMDVIVYDSDPLAQFMAMGNDEPSKIIKRGKGRKYGCN